MLWRALCNLRCGDRGNGVVRVVKEGGSREIGRGEDGADAFSSLLCVVVTECSQLDELSLDQATRPRYLNSELA